MSHIDENGRAVMVDVSSKEVVRRTAVAKGTVFMDPRTVQLASAGQLKKGDVFACARLAGIMSAKKTSELIPLCHNIPLDSVSVDLEPGEGHISIRATASCAARTGVEMEALTAVSVAALTIYDMCKAVDKKMSIGEIHLVEKRKGATA